MEQIIGILSDTHLTEVNSEFIGQIDNAFGQCDTIIHAGDLTSLSILEAFADKRVIAVHGNMCSQAVRRQLPESRLVEIGGFRIAVCHGAGAGFNIEERLFERFHDADCIVYGHTHQPVHHRQGSILYVNPGSFKSTGRYGNPGSYALLVINKEGLSVQLKTLTASP